MDGQVTWLDLGISCGKTWSEPLAATKEKTSQPCSKRSSKSSNRKPPVLKCLKRAGLPGEGITMKWEDDGAWCGELTTRNTGECPNAVVVSRLSQILEETPHPKYNLTAKACQGILRRAERRGKDLPKLLKQVLIQQSQGASPQERTEAPAPTETPTSYAVRIRGGCDGGGKGALVQAEKSGTLGCGNDQTIFCLQGDGIDRADTAGCNGKGWRENTCYTLNTIDRPAVCAGFKLGNSEQARSIGYQEELSPTLNAECGGNKPAVVALDMTHACDVIRECGQIVPSAAEVASSCKQRDFKDSTDLVITHMVVRRLTPMECERLQGFPDRWTDIGEWTDEKGKKHKDADSPRYKALGNSIALPFWDWMLRRMARYLPEHATLGSLFDGIGGFPLVWQETHGDYTARWASEIEEFPIAVTKLRFPEPETKEKLQ